MAFVTPCGAARYVDVPVSRGVYLYLGGCMRVLRYLAGAAALAGLVVRGRAAGTG
jgi:hypothetical protein